MVREDFSIMLGFRCEEQVGNIGMIELGKILRLKEAYKLIVTERRLLWWKRTAEE